MTDEKRDDAQGEAAILARDISASGQWTPFVDWSSTFPGNRGVNRQGCYELYDAPIGIALRIEAAEKSEPLLAADAAWEGNGELVPLRVWKEHDQYHMLYSAHPLSTKNPGLGDNRHLCYAVSDDGHNWTRPELGQIEWGGSRKNNIIADGPTGTPFLDPQSPPQERFKAIGQEGAPFDPDTGEQLDTDEAYKRWRAMEYEGAAYKGPKMVSRHWVSGWTSPDGIHWKNIGRLADMSSDGGSAAQYDPETNSYFAYIRVGGMGRRATGLTRTTDFWHWPGAELVLAPDPQDPPDVSFYGTSYFPYPGNKNLHGAFIEIYHQVTDHNDAQIAFSHDMTHWYRPERRAIIPVGPPGSRDSCGARPWGGLFELPDGYWATMYRGQSSLHNYRDSVPQIERTPGVLKMARWLPHRFCGIEAETEGRFTIPTVTRQRNELRLNYRCKPGGWISAELIEGIPSRIHPDALGIPGYTFAEADRLTGDNLCGLVSWQGNSDISSVSQNIAIRLKMFEAKIFAYSI